MHIAPTNAKHFLFFEITKTFSKQLIAIVHQAGIKLSRKNEIIRIKKDINRQFVTN